MIALEPAPLPSAMAERPALLLGVDLQEWPLRSLESVLAPRGFSCTMAFGGRQALGLVERLRPDAILMGTELGDMSAEEFLRSLPDLGACGRGLPVAVLQHAAESRSGTVALLDAGAWAVLAPPVDADLLLAQLTAFVRARREIERHREEALVDHETGLWTASGLRRRTEELLAEALRYDRAVTCVVASFGGSDAPSVLLSAAERLRSVVRQSDVLARCGRQELAIVAAAETGDQLDRMLARVTEALAPSPQGVGELPSLGRATALSYRDTRESASELLDRARASADAR